MLRLLDLFAGIGGMSLGLQRSGHFRPVAFCEIDPFCQHVLRKHWPEVPIYGDVRTLNRARLAADGIAVDAICGGFPCQDISAAGRGAGLHGSRSVLWREFARLLGDLRPRYAIVENVDALAFRGLGIVLGDLAALGFDAVWHCIPAAAVGARHLRERVWIVAYTDRSGLEEQFYRHAPELAAAVGTHTWGSEPPVGRMAYGISPLLVGGGVDEAAVAHPEGGAARRLAGRKAMQRVQRDAPAPETSSGLFEAERDRHPLPAVPRRGRHSSRLPEGEAAEALQGVRNRVPAEPQPEAQHVQPGVPLGDRPPEFVEAVAPGGRKPKARKRKLMKNRVNRVRALGNSAVPQIPEIIGRLIGNLEAA